MSLHFEGVKNEVFLQITQIVLCSRDIYGINYSQSYEQFLPTSTAYHVWWVVISFKYGSRSSLDLPSVSSLTFLKMRSSKHE